MTKREFTDAIVEKLSGLPEDALHQALDFFSEGIDDRMEDGMSEAQAVAAMGSVDEAAEQILLDTPLPRIVRERVRPKRKLRAWEIVLLALGSPVWAPLALAAAVVAAACYGVLWVLLACLYIVDASLAIVGLAGLVGAVFCAVRALGVQAMLSLGFGLMGAGFSVLFFFACSAAARGTARATRRLALAMRAGFLKRGKEA